ncbi:hypothetical protein IGI04_006102 [Brassica rapa subsp. trilocularis]|uniref:Uncharacterized protein n=1 Tax=Brassica rapa subsp. trilocularis TaxID=1813537 RepID=A0ABQ7NGD3_BRACM|nr:hypothetical protein IGI04_006102 [Brassica rapa subsp. trilocularis]
MRSVAVCQHKKKRQWLSVCVRVCPSAHTGRLWLSISTHISTLVLGLSMLALPVDCSDDFGPLGLSVQYSQDVRGCSSAHPVPHTGRLWLSISTHISTFVLGLSTLTLLVDCLGDFGPRGLSGQYTQDIRGCLPAHTGSLWLSGSTHMTSVAVRVYPCVSVCVCQHTQDVRGCPSVHISARWSLDSARWPFPWTVRVILAHVGCLLSTHMTSVGVRKHPQDVCGYLWLSVSTHRTSVSVCVCLCPSAHTGRLWLSISTHISTLVLGLSTLALPVDCLGDFDPHNLSVYYTEEVRGCPPAHTGHLWLSVSTHRTFMAVRVCLWVSARTHRTSVGVRQHTQDVRVCPSAHAGRPCVPVSTHRTSVAFHQYTYQHAGPWTQHAGPSRRLFTHMTSVAVSCESVDVRQHTQDVRVCPSAHTGRSCVSVSTHMTSVAVHQYTYQHVGPWTQHADPSRGLFGTSVCVRLRPSVHTGRLWLSISTHISTLVHGLSMLALPVDCLGNIGPRGLSVQYTQECMWVSASTHRTSMAVCGCPSADTGRLWLSVCVRHHTQDVLVVLQYTYQHAGPWTQHAALPVDCSDDFGPRGLSVQYTQDVRGCPSAHTGRPCVSVSTHRTFVAVRVCLCVSVKCRR